MSFDNLSFQAAWREYQARVLAELEGHLDDEHLHVVAAPGSGKTILGLEVMRRIGKPALIVAPTITIRNQWVQRLLDMFLPAGAATPEWISKNIRQPSYLTVITYQALHAAFSGVEEVEEDVIEEDEEEADEKWSTKKSEAVDVIRLLNERGVSTILLDEAHHLRKEWWKALTRLKEGLTSPTLVSLTATPPYDVDYNEWRKYEELCGPVDAEISIPELVKRGDLCPHQDYIYFSLPTKKEKEKLTTFKANVTWFVDALRANPKFHDMLNAHPWISDPAAHIEEILDEPDFFSAVVIYLNAIEHPLPGAALKILGAKRSELSPLTPIWLEKLLTGCLYTYAESFPDHQETIDELTRELKKLGAIERRKITIDNTKEIKKLLATSLGKLESVVEITLIESENLGPELRQVILADYIRKAQLPVSKDDLRPVEKIGVAPIFEFLRRAAIPGVRLGVLTGSLIIIPASARETLQTAAEEMELDPDHIRTAPLVYDPAFVTVDIRGEHRQKIVRLITEVFRQGGITVLVGTQALLGEGWDAPSINSLIMASYVGSYMLSNQMRGRAIRIDPARPGKTANIWHLVALDLITREEIIEIMKTGETKRKFNFTPFDEIQEDVGHDMNTLVRRFRAFEGVTYQAPFVIETGIRRLRLPKEKWTAGKARSLNAAMTERAMNRAGLPEMWEAGLMGGSPAPEMREKVESNYAPTSVSFYDTLRYLAYYSMMWGAYFASQIISVGAEMRVNVVVLLLYAGIVGSVVAAPGLLKALYLLLRNGTLEGSVQQVGYAVLETLQQMQLVKTDPRKLRVNTIRDKGGAAHCRLDGATAIERRYFLEALQEALGPTENPRYLLVRRDRLGPISRIDYHPVPTVIGQKKENALFFAKKWKRYVGSAELIYTRNREGRETLLQARTRSLASAFVRTTDRLSVWE